jgi:multiple sugar transport system permease protein
VIGERGTSTWRWPLAFVAVLPFAVPFVWLIASAFKPVDQFYSSPPTIFPAPPSLANLEGVLRLLDVPRLFANSTVIAALSAIFSVLSSAVVGYAFATLPARGRGLLFGLLVATIMIPPAVLIVPQFLLFSRIGWVDSWLPLIVPHLFGSPFYVFLFRQWFRNLPPNLFESAELDGASPIQAFRHVALPLARPALAAVAVFAFVASWNDFLGPLVYLRSPESFTVSLGIASFQGVYVNDLHFSVALALLALVPPVAVFFIAQRSLVQGIVAGGWRA